MGVHITATHSVTCSGAGIMTELKNWVEWGIYFWHLNATAKNLGGFADHGVTVIQKTYLSGTGD